MVEQEKKLTVNDYIEAERKIIFLMLKSRDVINEMLEGGYGIEFFDPNHQPIVEAIYKEFVNSGHKRRLTLPAYRQYLRAQGAAGDMMMTLEIFAKIQVSFAREDDFGYLKEVLTESYIARRSSHFLDQYKKDCQKSHRLAAQNLVEKLQSSLGTIQTRRAVFASLSELWTEYVSHLENLRNNPQDTVRCGIPEIDDPVNIGFHPQGLTLFVANVGGHKTNIMLNVGLNIADAGHSVLFIPLEMDWKRLMNRIVANRLRIEANHLAKPDKLLTEEELKKIKESDILNQGVKNFYILDADDRTSVSRLKLEIEKHAVAVKPKVVIVDYVDNLESDVKYGQKHIEIGEVLKSLRFLGKRYNFHTISAAQMGRAAIKALREGNEDALDSTSIHGSHQYSADSDTIFGMLQIKNEPDRIKIHTIKARNGVSGQTNELRVQPNYYLISSTDGRVLMKEDPDGFESDINAPQEVIQKSFVEFQGANLDDDFLSDLG